KKFPDQKGRLRAPLWLKGFPKPRRLAKPEELASLAAELRSEGFQRLMIDGEEVMLGEAAPPALAGQNGEAVADAPAKAAAPKAPNLKRPKAKEIFLVVDRVQISTKART